ncbi:hypothetical protein XPA_009647 [Xanthoria parietina]
MYKSLEWSSRIPHRLPTRHLASWNIRPFATTSPRAFTIDPTAPCNDCACQDQVPSDLAIDRIKPLNNTVPYYNQHIIISTGKSDWESRIENESEGANMAKALKEMTKRTPGRDDHSPLQ